MCRPEKVSDRKLKKNKGFGGVDIHFDILFRIKFTV